MGGDTYIEGVATAVPEPSALALASLGFGGVAAGAWWRRRRVNPA
jgi:PEP-CTERM motif